MTAVAVWTTVACAAGADEPDVPRVESTGEAPGPASSARWTRGWWGSAPGGTTSTSPTTAPTCRHPCSTSSYAGDAEAREVEPIEATEREGVSFGDPVVAGDRLIIPEFGDDGLVAVTTVE